MERHSRFRSVKKGDPKRTFITAIAIRKVRAKLKKRKKEKKKRDK